MLALLESEHRAQIRAILSNGAYLESKEGLTARKSELDKLAEHFDKAIQNVVDPGREEREQRMMSENPLFAAGQRGLEKIKWDILAAQERAAQLREQGF